MVFLYTVLVLKIPVQYFVAMGSRVYLSCDLYLGGSTSSRVVSQRAERVVF